MNKLDGVEIHDAFNILITGRSGVGKSTLINLVHNYFSNSAVGQLQQIVDPSSERRSQSMTSSTSACVRYIYRSNDGYLYQIIDSPGLADTSGHEEDEKNMQLIIKAAECVEHINCVLFVCNGTGDTRLGLDIRTTFVLLKNTLPTAVLNNVMAFFTFTADLSANKCNLNEVLRLENGTCLIDVKKMPKYCADSSFFDPMDPSLPPRARKANQRRQEDN
jgi:GTP-binding protein EngB required for normal cell division